MSNLKAAIMPVTPFSQNCTLLWCAETNKAALVDPGGEVDRILAAIEEQGVEVEKILLTHGHIDHAGGAAELRDKLEVPIEGPQREDAFWLDQLEQSAESYGFEGVRNVTPDRWLEEGDKVTVGTLELDVFHCPGHTPGHVVFYHQPSKLALVGDVLFEGSVGRTDFPRSDTEALILSIKQKLWPLGEDVTFIPGHGPASTFGRERRTNPFVGDNVS